MASSDSIRIALEIFEEYWDDGTFPDVTIEGKQLWVLGPSPKEIAGTDECEELEELNDHGWHWDTQYRSWWKQL